MLTRLTENYVAIPLRLVADLRDTPVALGLYALIARLYLIVQVPVPLSRSDIQQYDPALKEGAVKRALDRLTGAGWLTEVPGPKRRYVPTWGRSRAGIARPWQIGPRLGCPTHIFTIRLDKAILDTYLGKLTPHGRLPAAIERYLSAPLLSLRDVGAYVLAAAGQPLASTAALYRWELVRDGQAQPIPTTEQVLALASQRQQADVTAARLLPAGWARLGVPRMPPDHVSQPSSQTQTPFFAPKALIGELIPQLIADSIGGAPSSAAPSIPRESPQAGTADTTATMPGNRGIPIETSESPPIPPIREDDCGGGVRVFDTKKEQERTLLNTESARALFSIGVNDPDCLVELATTPIEQVGGAIRYAEAEDLGPGWVVTALRRHRDEGWPIPQVRRRRGGAAIDVASVLNGAYGDLFRLGSDTSDLPPFGRTSAAETPTRSSPTPALRAVCGGPPQASVSAPVVASRPAPVHSSVAELTQELRSRLLLGCARSDHPLIRKLEVHIAGDTTVIHCATLADRMRVLDAHMGALRACAAELGLPAMIRVTDAAPPAEEQARAVGQGVPGTHVCA